MTIEDQIEALWTAGNKAPYDLFDGMHFLDGYRILVEAIGPDAVPVIKRGDTITPDIAMRVSKQIRAQNDPAMLTIVEVSQ